MMSSLSVLRVFGGIFAVSLCLMGSWLAGAEFMRAAPAPFPGTAPAAVATANERSRAGTAAAIGLVRGDLWADFALALAGDVLGNTAPAATPEQIASTRAVAERAAALAPHDGRLWLLLAMLEARLGRPASDGPGGGPLQMSYFTAPNE